MSDSHGSCEPFGMQAQQQSARQQSTSSAGVQAAPVTRPLCSVTVRPCDSLTVLRRSYRAYSTGIMDLSTMGFVKKMQVYRLSRRLQVQFVRDAGICTVRQAESLIERCTYIYVVSCLHHWRAHC